MLHAAAMFVCLALVAALLAPGQLWIILGVTGASVLAAAWLGGGSPSPLRLVTTAPQSLARFVANLAAAATVGRAALAADVSLKPALVRLRIRPRDSHSLAALAGMISAAPGANVVETDAESLLVHVLNEDELDAERLGAVAERSRVREEMRE